jgi:hypothetical protein
LGLLSGWLQADSFVKAAWGDAEAVVEEGRKAASAATAERDKAWTDAKAAKEHCLTAETKLKALVDERVDDAHRLEEQLNDLGAQKTALDDRGAELKWVTLEQATERSRLEKLKKETEAARESLDKAEKVAAVERDAFASLEEKLRASLRSLYGSGHKEPLATLEEGPAGLLRRLATVLEDVATELPVWVEAEARGFTTSVVTRVYHHLFLQDSNFDLSTLLEPPAPELQGADAKAMEEQVEALLQQFRPVDLTAAAEEVNGGGGGDVVDDGAPQADGAKS